MKREFPFLLKVLFCFFVLDGLEKFIYLGLYYHSAPEFQLFHPLSMLYMIIGAFDFLLVTQLILRIKLIRVWLSFYLSLNIAYQAIYFVRIAPQDWFMLSELNRTLQLTTLLINLGILWYIHTPQCCEELTE